MRFPRVTSVSFIGVFRFCSVFPVAGDLVHAWDAHGLRLPLSKFERLPRDGVLFRVLDRVQVRT